MAAKATGHVIPLCHVIPLDAVNVTTEMIENEYAVDIRCLAKCTGKTGVEMEALHGASVAALTIYDMCKAINKEMEIRDIRLVSKDGGKSGPFVRQ